MYINVKSTFTQLLVTNFHAHAHNQNQQTTNDFLFSHLSLHVSSESCHWRRLNLVVLIKNKWNNAHETFMIELTDSAGGDGWNCVFHIRIVVKYNMRNNMTWQYDFLQKWRGLTFWSYLLRLQSNTSIWFSAGTDIHAYVFPNDWEEGGILIISNGTLMLHKQERLSNIAKFRRKMNVKFSVHLPSELKSCCKNRWE